MDQLSKHYPSPVREPGPGYQRQQEQKAQQKTPKKPRGEKRPRKKRESNAALDENGERPKKRKRKSTAKGRTAGQDGPIMPPDYPGAAPVDGEYTALQSVADAVNGSGGQPQQAGPSTSGVVSFNVSPEEAGRRLDIARKLLSEAGVNPDTLSADQMNIFANQSPELQKDSVAMLAKYGAERLQIIHPNNKDKTSSEQSSGSATPVVQGASSGNMTTTKELAPGSQSSGRKRRPTEKAANEQATEGTPSRRKPGKSRVACFQCKSRKVKVGPFHPKTSLADLTEPSSVPKIGLLAPSVRVKARHVNIPLSDHGRGSLRPLSLWMMTSQTRTKRSSSKRPSNSLKPRSPITTGYTTLRHSRLSTRTPTTCRILRCPLLTCSLPTTLKPGPLIPATSSLLPALCYPSSLNRT